MYIYIGIACNTLNEILSVSSHTVQRGTQCRIVYSFTVHTCVEKMLRKCSKYELVGFRISFSRMNISLGFTAKIWFLHQFLVIPICCVFV